MNAYRFRIPLTTPLNLKGQIHTVREGILLQQNGRWAEASPLPGFSAETIDDVIDALNGNRPAPPSLQFAISSLEQPIFDEVSVPWNFLLLGERDQVLSGVDRCIESNCTAAKLKVGRGDMDDEIQLVHEVRNRLPENVQLRLDANQAWNFEDAVSFAELICDVDFEYIEEPLKDSNQLEDLFAWTGVRYALDETLLQHQSLDAWPHAAALICKPTILGGREAVHRLAESGKPVIFSAAFESGVGIARIVQLAAEFSPSHAAGLDTLDWLETDLLVRSAEKRADLFFVSDPMPDLRQLERII